MMTAIASLFSTGGANPLVMGGAVIAVIIGGFVWLKLHDRGVINAEANAANAKTEATARKADDAAADQRVADTVKVDEESSHADAAIAASGPDTPPSAAELALNEQRLRDASK